MMNNNEQLSSQRITVSNPTLQRMIDSNAAMQYSNQMIISQSMGSRPVNTTKACVRKQDKWKVNIPTCYYQYKRS
jgi:hypothetical protein